MRLEISSPRPDDHDSFPYKRVKLFIMHVDDVSVGQEAKNKQNIQSFDKIDLHKLYANCFCSF